jgi:hypothetical protein
LNGTWVVVAEDRGSRVSGICHGSCAVLAETNAITPAASREGDVFSICDCAIRENQNHDGYYGNWPP